MSANTKPRARQIKVGDTFRSTYADSNPLWRVIRSAGRGVWEAVIENEPIEFRGRMIDSDYAGHTDVFKTDHIRRSMAWSDMVTNLVSDQTDWFGAQEVGAVIHYCNGFNQFVRGTVVVMTEENTEPGTSGRRDVGQKGLLPTALVGEVRDRAEPGKQGWFRSDIVIRRPDGRIDYGHHARNIIDGNGAWQPSITCIFEHPAATNYHKGPDPRTLPVIDLSPPEADDPDSEALVRHYNEVRAVLNETPRDGMDAVAKLSQARALLDRGPEFVTWEAESAYRNGS